MMHSSILLKSATILVAGMISSSTGEVTASRNRRLASIRGRGPLDTRIGKKLFDYAKESKLQIYFCCKGFSFKNRSVVKKKKNVSKIKKAASSSIPNPKV